MTERGGQAKIVDAIERGIRDPRRSPTRAIGYVSNPLKQPPAAGPPLRIGPPVAGLPRGIAPVQTSKLANSYAVRIDR